MTMYIALENINALAAGRHIKLLKDVPISLSDEEAQELSRLGVIRPADIPAVRVQAQAEVAAIEFTEEIEIIAPVSQPVEPPPARRTRTKQPKR